jgi:predicted metal-dependent phosphoesterase TrpH
MVSTPAVKKPRPRALAACLFVIAVAIGTLADDVPHRLPLRAGGFFVLSGDFHVHAFPGDGALTPWALRDEAARAGLDVVAVTNHNHGFTARLAQWLAGFSGGPIVIAGEEITNPAYHLIAIGINRAVRADQPAQNAIAEVHAQGGLAIAAHPGPKFRGYDSDGAVALLDGTEAAHPARLSEEKAGFAAFFERARRLKPMVAPIGSSDFHVSGLLGECRTLVFARERSAAAVIEAIRGGRTLAVNEDGSLIGDSRLVQLVRGELPAGRTRAHSGWPQLAVVLAWLGLFGMLLLA